MELGDTFIHMQYQRQEGVLMEKEVEFRGRGIKRAMGRLFPGSLLNSLQASFTATDVGKLKSKPHGRLPYIYHHYDSTPNDKLRTNALLLYINAYLFILRWISNALKFH